ncbi:MAG: hypothetical protein M1821_007447 [Bathelium mastoideum]|nr:MAG: hypothetical protein M1821_007447 [Bathelium mastoideum]
MDGSLFDLTAVVHNNIAQIERLNDSNKVEPSNGDTGAPQNAEATFALHQTVETCKENVLEALDKLRFALLGPVAYLQAEVLQSITYLTSLQGTTRFSIATSVPLDSKISYGDLARACKVPESDLQRLIRHAITNYVFCEPSPGFVAHTELSRYLATNPGARAWLAQTTEDMWPAAVKAVDAIQKWPGSEEPGESGFSVTNQTTDSYYVEMNKQPERLQRFKDTMKLFHESAPGLQVKHVIAAYDWATVEDCLVVDVGGSHGVAARELTRQFPRITCIVQDLPDVIAAANSAVNVKNGEYSSRVRYMSHDFLQEQPIKGADIYFFRMIFHNWSDKYSIKILRSLIPALKPGAKVLACDIITPLVEKSSFVKARHARASDLAMKAILNAKERDLDDWKELFQKADSRFHYRGVKTPHESSMGILEFVWEP